MINFPPNPSLGDSYTYIGIKFVYDSIGWGTNGFQLDSDNFVTLVGDQTIDGRKTFLDSATVNSPMMVGTITPLGAMHVGGDLYIDSDGVINNLQVNHHLNRVSDVVFARTTAVHALTATTASQKCFGTDVSPNGSVFLEVGTYQFYMYLTVNAMGTAVTNAAIGFVDDTAVTTGIRIITRGADAAAMPTTASWSQAPATTLSTNPAVVASATQAMVVEAQGWFTVTTAGRVIPTIQLGAAAAATVATNGLFWAERITDTTTNTKGVWS